MLLKMVKKGNGPRLALLPEPDPNQMAETLVAFANADGGTLLIGVNDSGRATGQLIPDELDNALREAVSLCSPPVTTSVDPGELPSGLVMAIKVARSGRLHSLADGRILVRQGNENRALDGASVSKLASLKSSENFEEEMVPGGVRERDWDEEIVNEYLDKREERGAARTTSVDQLLIEIGALTEHGVPTVAGMLLFGSKPSSFLPQSSVTFVKFPGTELRAENGLAGYGRREELHGPLARVLERIWNIIWEEMSVGSSVDDLVRKDDPSYPRFAVREALVNAVAHRDYQIKGRRIEIRMFSDRLEIISPGGLPGYITVDNIVDEHYSRNPRLVNGLFHWGFIEELGLGIDRMIEEMVEAGQPPPTFKATPHSFSVTLHAKKIRPPAHKWERRMNDRQAKALAFIRENGSITNREYRGICPHVSPETLRLDLADLVKKAVLLKIGAKKGTYYILK
ncbi:MAG: ATP-binding protein [Chloroflexota bacterium]